MTTGLEFGHRLTVALLDTPTLSPEFAVFLLESIDGFEERASLDYDRKVVCAGNPDEPSQGEYQRACVLVS